MTDRKRWTIQEETELKELVEAAVDVGEIAGKLNKTPGAVIVKCQRLGLQLQIKGYLNSSVSLPRELPSVEETAKILAGALKASVKPGLNRLEVQRLQTVANISKMYKEIIVDFVHYREVEKKLNEVIEQYAALQETIRQIRESTQNSSSQPVSA